jgi:hypothetical protein
MAKAAMSRIFKLPTPRVDKWFQMYERPRVGFVTRLDADDASLDACRR